MTEFSELGGELTVRAADTGYHQVFDPAEVLALAARLKSYGERMQARAEAKARSRGR